MIPSISLRRRLRSAALLGTAVSAVMLGVSIVGAVRASALPAGTAPTAGQAMSVTSGTGTSTWGFTLAAPNNTCPGDGLAGYRWTTFMVPASVDAATLTYNSLGPIAPTGVSFAQPLFSAAGQPQVAKTPGIGDGLITGAPAQWSFNPIVPLPVPNGQYKIGYACTRLVSGVTQTERYWQTLITVSNSTATSFDFAVTATPPPTTTTVAPTTVAPTTVAPTTAAPTTTTPAITTTTTAGATTTTTTPGTTTTTTTPGTTTTTTAGTTTTTSVAAGGPTTTIATTFPIGTLPNTGPSRSVSIAIWGALLLVFGRIVVLLARPVRVAPPKSR